MRDLSPKSHPSFTARRQRDRPRCVAPPLTPTTEATVARPRRTPPRALIAGLTALVLALGVWLAVSGGPDDDVPVDPTTPEARAAAAVALDVVPGRVVGVARDQDDGKWEVAIVQEGREYEVELAHPTLTLLRLDYTTD